MKLVNYNFLRKSFLYLAKREVQKPFRTISLSARKLWRNICETQEVCLLDSILGYFWSRSSSSCRLQDPLFFATSNALVRTEYDQTGNPRYLHN